ncbi:MAG: putative RNA polymerase [Prokaryotic dsDNA virus sp.]|nr:MAG: putative RNA polymerase [Prokaryotic dsDNA virus sp.]
MKEQEMNDMGRKRYRSVNQKLKEKQCEASTKYGRKLAKACIPALDKKIHKWLTEDKAGYNKGLVLLLHNIPSKVVTDITCRVILDSVSIEQPLTATAIKIASFLEEESRLRLFKETRPDDWKYLKLSLNKRVGFKYRKYSSRSLAERYGINWKGWTTNERIKIGSTMVHLFIQETGLIEVYTIISGGNKRVLTLKPTEATQKWISNFNEVNETLAPLYLPSESPRGYSDAVISTKSEKQWELLDRVNLTIPRQAVGKLKSTPWVVNQEVYDVAHYFWANQYQVADFPPFALDNIPPKPADFDSNEEAKKKWKYEAAKYYREDHALRSSRLRVSKMLWVAREYMEKTMYFPHQMDFRGRAYCIPNFLNPQGPDLARALLKFERKVEVGQSMSNLIEHGANLYGGFDSDWQEKVKETLYNPTGFLWWADAKNPWQFLAWVFDYANAVETGETSLPVSADASSNGLQILSLILKDEEGALWTNLTNDSKHDIYSRIQTEVEAELNIPITRDLVKSIVMTIPYGCTTFRAIEITKAWLGVKYTKDTLDKADTIAKTIINIFSRLYPKYPKVLRYLKGLAEGHEGEVSWLSPSGFPITLDYRKEKIHKCSSYILGKSHSLTYREPTDKLDRTKIARSFAPNFVHSLDASIMHMALSSTALTDVYSIHDCFGTHAPNLPELIKNVKQAYLKIFRNDSNIFFEKIFTRKTLEKQCYYDFQKDLSKIIGKFSVDEVWHSKYMYS